ncbi:hypothetical protein TRIUR3_19138 [Triticum urartu]|uniref:Uncharacterized protein n=1 Tax=Triticum urartu TaxID=4572 RepID=M8A4V1_TRIUA|nr:hypothetical protein TRIUR3_19138 [Triticum urartu]
MSKAPRMNYSLLVIEAAGVMKMASDCDILYLADVAELIASAVPSDAAAAKRLAVVCVKHEYAPLETTKMDGAMQTVYPRKNWSSMLIASAVPSDAAAAKRLAVVCVKHEYAPLETTKMDGAMQTVYPRKNWSSMVLYNCAHPKNVATLTPDAVSTKTGAFLHRFSWLEDDEIGEVPFVWNFLVGHNKVDPDDPTTKPKALHYTCGGPWFDRYRDCEFADLWIKEAEELRAEKEKRKAEKERLELEDDEDDEGN